MSALRFFFYPGGFENTRKPCIVRESATGGDDVVLATIERIYHPDALHELCSAANVTLESREGQQ